MFLGNPRTGKVLWGNQWETSIVEWASGYWFSWMLASLHCIWCERDPPKKKTQFTWVNTSLLYHLTNGYGSPTMICLLCSHIWPQPPAVAGATGLGWGGHPCATLELYTGTPGQPCSSALFRQGHQMPGAEPSSHQRDGPLLREAFELLQSR